MDADRPGDSLTDPAVDRELQAMLAVDPSSDFIARLRTRVADEPPTSPWWLSWRFVAVVAMAAVVVLAAVMLRPREAVRPQPVARRATSTDVARPVPPTAATAQEPRVASAFRRTETANSPKAGHDARSTQTEPRALAGDVGRPFQVRLSEPEILVDARESSALRALILGARDGRIDFEPVLRASTPTAMDLPPVSAIDIPFLTIDPIAPGTGEEGVRQ